MIRLFIAVLVSLWSMGISPSSASDTQERSSSVATPKRMFCSRLKSHISHVVDSVPEIENPDERKRLLLNQVFEAFLADRPLLVQINNKTDYFLPSDRALATALGMRPDAYTVFDINELNGIGEAMIGQDVILILDKQSRVTGDLLSEWIREAQKRKIHIATLWRGSSKHRPSGLSGALVKLPRATGGHYFDLNLAEDHCQ